MKLIAHRGGRGFGTDNTLEAMEAATKAGVRMIELDVRMTEDDRLVVCHDAIIWGRMVRHITYEELLKHASDRPLLADVFEKLAGWVRFNVEVKQATERAVGEMLESYGIAEDTLVSSFNRIFLERFKEQFPSIPTGYLFRSFYGFEKKLEDAVTVGARTVLPHFHSIDERLVEKAHDYGFEVCAWTVNNQDDFKRLFSWGVDGIITDQYLELEEILEELGQHSPAYGED